MSAWEKVYLFFFFTDMKNMKLLDQIILFDDEFTPSAYHPPTKHSQALLTHSGMEKSQKFPFYFPLLRISVTFCWRKSLNSSLCFDLDFVLLFFVYLKLVCHSIWFHFFSLGGFWYQNFGPNFPKEVIKQIKITFQMFSVQTIVADTVYQLDS